MNPIADVHFLAQPAAPQVETRFDPANGSYWAYMNPSPRPCFNPTLLAQLHAYITTITANQGTIVHDGERHAIRYGVLASKTPGVFNLGGDLALFREAIQAGARDALIHYGEKCLDDLYPWYRNCDLPMTTIALVQGEALGGGFEAALSATVLVAEESSRMGFPEILFNLFPGMGAYSFLARKVGRRVAERMITSGNVYEARELYELGVVDVITPDGTGEAAVDSFIRKHAKAGNGRRAIEQVRNEIEPITREELSRVVAIWADAALRLEDRDLRMMDRLVRAQLRSQARGTDAAQGDALQPTAQVLPLQAAAGS
ncbi:MAG: crotonase/enoyl-CoA hydratase family protein [Proteobacteria bacterium]|nr:crotonase/enoyl-CoA hydratase family protein [Pseudomonadota bacterium]